MELALGGMGFVELTTNEAMEIEGGFFDWEKLAAGIVIVGGLVLTVSSLPVTAPIVVATAAVAFVGGAYIGAGISPALPF